MSIPLPSKPKIRLATVSLAGCFGCHMSFLDMDERILALAEIIELDFSPFTDIQTLGICDIGLVEGGVCNAENVHTLRAMRAACKVLVALGACAVNGGLPAMRNHLDIGDILSQVYDGRAESAHETVPDDPELPLLLDKVHPIHEVVLIDYVIPGCPPSGDAIHRVLCDLIAGRTPRLNHDQLHYD